LLSGEYISYRKHKYFIIENNNLMRNSTKPFLRIRALRESKGFTQEYMAEMLGISQSTYAHLESGKANMDIGRLLRIADILETDMTELVETGKGDNSQPPASTVVAFSTPLDPERQQVHDRLIGELLNEIAFLRSLLRHQMGL
jgi:transcriptional regulator with XRE-family HTH domain